MRLMKLSLMLACAAALVAVAPALAQEAGLDHSEAEGCASCHSNPGMAETAMDWEASEHGMSYDFGAGANTYCAECKSPLLWDPAATHEDNDPIAVEDWQDVTCGGCHPPHHLRVEWGTPIGIVVDPTAAEDHDIWMPLYDTNELCEYCHSGSRHARDFQGWGKVMYEKKDVTCVDCHMADTPNSSPDGFGEYHEFTVADNLPYSCGIGDGACHANKTSDWAAKQMAKAKIHGKN